MAVRTRKPAARKKKAPAGTQASRQAQKQMWAVVLFAAGLLLGALTFIKGDKLWLAFHDFLFGLFGWSALFIAPLIIYIAVIAAMDRPISTIRNKLWQTFVLIAMISGAIQIFGEPLSGRGTITEAIKSLYAEGVALEGGGVVSVIFAFPLLSLFGKTGASIIVVLCIFVFAMLVTGSTLIGLFRSASKPVKDLEGAYAAAAESRELKRREIKRSEPKRPERVAQVPEENTGEKAARFDINVDIEDDTEPGEEDSAPWDEEPKTPEMPMHPVMSQKPEPREKPAVPTESPVEYISPEEFIKTRPDTSEPAAEPVPAAQPPQPRRHSLDEDILRAERETDDELDAIIERFAGMGAKTPLNGAEFPKNSAIPTEFPTEPEAESMPAPPPQSPVSAVQPPATIPAFADPPLENRPPYVYQKPSANLLKQAKAVNDEDAKEELKQNAQTLVDTLNSFGVQTRVTEICRGPAVTRYELQPSAGVKISKITGLADDIALNLASAGIRIEAPIPNKAAVGIEVPNKNVSIVSIRELIDSIEFQNPESKLSVALGRDIAGNIVLADIGKMPHLLIAGSTGSGKSVCINSIIISLLYKASPEDVKLLMVDPKLVELGVYNGIPHLLVPVVTDSKKAAGALCWAVAEMERRYKEFADHNVRDLAGYNNFARTNDVETMPQIVIIIDELADLMMVASKEVEEYICRLAQKARAAGMHLVIATQRPSVDVITGLIKANIPSRVAFMVSSMVDSRTILDMGGAEKLLGRGDMLFYPVGASKPQRVQGCFVTDSEVESVVEYIKAGEMARYDQQIVEEIDRHVIPEKTSGKDGGGFDDDNDEMLPQAIECVIEAGQASTSLLQRRLKVGYARAGRIIDQMEELGIVGPFEGSKPRQILISRERWLEMKLSGNEIFSGKLNQDEAE